MTEKSKIYQIQVSDSLFNFIVVKDYGGEIKHRRMDSIEECLKQVDEWDKLYSISHPGETFIKGIKADKKKEYRVYKRKFNVIERRSGKIISTGTAKELSEMFNCHVNTITHAATCNAAFKNEYMIKVAKA